MSAAITPSLATGVRPRSVLVAGTFHADCFAGHIAEGFDALGCTTSRHEMRPAPRSHAGSIGHRLWMARETVDSVFLQRMPSVRVRRLDRLVGALERGGAELLVMTYEHLLPAEVEAIKRRTSATVVLWYPDHMMNLGRMACLASPYDALFFKDPYMVESLGDKAIGPVYYLPDAFNPARHRLPEGPIDREPYRCQITTAGNLHAARLSVFRQLDDYDVRIWGNPPPSWLPAGPVAAMYQGRYVVDEEKAVAFTSASIVLNTLYPGEIWGLNMRAFEAAGVGGFQLLDWRPGLGQLFDDGREVVSFRGIADLRDKVEYYLARPDDRAAIARAGEGRAARDHSYAHRLRTMLNTLDGRGSGHPMPRISCGESNSTPAEAV